MIYKVLSREEWGLLAQAPDGAEPDPDCTHVLAAIDEEGNLAGRLFLVLIPHIEGVWIREDHRGKGVWEALVEAAEAEMRKFRLPALFAFSTSPAMTRRARRHGYVLRADLSVLTKGV